MERMVVGLGVVIATLAWAGLAGADDTDKRGAHEVSPVVIHGRHARPLAVTEVARVVPKVTVPDVKQRFADRIEEPIAREPF